MLKQNKPVRLVRMTKTPGGIVTNVCLGLALLLSGMVVPGGDKSSDETLAEASAPLFVQSIPRAAWSIFRGFVPAEQTPAPTGHAEPETRSRAPDDSSPAQPEPSQPDSEQAEAVQTVHQRVAQRYQNPLVVQFLQTLTPELGVALYLETAQLIDSRHIEPTSYQVRMQRGVENLVAAVETPAFLQANRINSSPANVREFTQTLKETLRQYPVKNSRDAANFVRWAMNLASRQVGLNPSSVVLEFLYGATESLDMYSAFVPPQRSGNPNAAVDDHVVGIGVEVEPDDDGLRIRGVLPGGPAEQAQLRKGDVILSVDGKSLAGLSISESVNLIAGPQGSTLILEVRRGSQQGRVRLTRRFVQIQSVTDVQMLGGDQMVGYLKLKRFGETSRKEMEEALWNLHNQGMQSLVVDLRGNPGGLLTAAIDISNMFVPCGTLVSTKGRLTQDNSQERATFDQTWKVPLVVLIDSDSASASEIFAAAIQDNQRGLVVGRQSYGKGTVQTHFNLQTVAANLRLTTAHFYAPSGREMAEIGVKPDVLIELAEGTEWGDPLSDQDLMAALNIAGGDSLKNLSLAATRCRIGSQSQLQS